MRNILISLFCLIAVVGCGNPSNKDATQQANVPGSTPVNVYSQHNALACPTQLVGVYELQNNDNGRRQRSREFLKITIQNNGVLVVTQQVDGVDLYATALVADGLRKNIASQNVNDYQIAYCENQSVVAIGYLQGKDFKQTLRGTRFGVDLTYETSAMPAGRISYRKIGL